MDVSIRRARGADAEPSKAVIAAAYAAWRARLDDLPDVTAGVADDIARGMAWVAEADGRVIGILIARVHDGILHVANLAVAPEAGGRGVGTSLVRAAETQAERSGILTLRLATHAAMTGNIAFYERLGWRVSGREGNRVLMARHLPSTRADG